MQFLRLPIYPFRGAKRSGMRTERPKLPWFEIVGIHMMDRMYTRAERPFQPKDRRRSRQPTKRARNARLD